MANTLPTADKKMQIFESMDLTRFNRLSVVRNKTPAGEIFNKFPRRLDFGGELVFDYLYLLKLKNCR